MLITARFMIGLAVGWRRSSCAVLLEIADRGSRGGGVTQSADDDGRHPAASSSTGTGLLGGLAADARPGGGTFPDPARGLVFMPETPRYLVHAGEEETAPRS